MMHIRRFAQVLPLLFLSTGATANPGAVLDRDLGAFLDKDLTARRFECRIAAEERDGEGWTSGNGLESHARGEPEATRLAVNPRGMHANCTHTPQ